MGSVARFRDNAMLRTGDGRLFLAAQALDATATGVAQVALPWLVLDATGSEAQAGLIFMLGVAPYVVFGLPAGLVADRFPRRRVIWIAHALQALFAVVVPLWAISGLPPVWIVAATAFLIGGARAFSDAGAFGAISSLIGRENFSSGQAILGAAWSTGFVAGPAIGGALIGLIGAPATLGAQAVAFAIAAVLILLVRSSFGEVAAAAGSALEGILEGVRFLVTDPLLRTLNGVGTLWNLAAAGSWALSVPLLREEIGLSSHQAGAALAAGAIAGIAAAPVLHRIERRWSGPQLYVMTIFWSAPPIALLGIATGFWSALGAMVLVNLVDWIVMSVFIGERQRRAPDELQARVGISGRMLMTASMTVGTAVASSLVTVISLRELFVGMSVATMLVGVLAVPLVRRAARRFAVA
jgi:MFS family permease